MSASQRRRICLMMGPGTLPSQGRERMDLTHYNAKLSGKPRLSLREMDAAFLEIERSSTTKTAPMNRPPMGTCGVYPTR